MGNDGRGGEGGGGLERIAQFRGGGMNYRAHPPEGSESGIGLVFDASSKEMTGREETGREVTSGGGGGGGPQPYFGEGFYGMLSSPLSSPPFAAL